MGRKFDSNKNLQEICWDTKPEKLDNHKIQSALKSLHMIIREQQTEIGLLKKKLLAARGSNKLYIESLKKIDSISLYMYLSEFYPEIYIKEKKNIQASKKLKATRFKSFREAHLFLWKNYLVDKPIKDNTPMAILSSWTTNMANSFKNPKECVTAILICLDSKGYLDYEGRTFNKLGEVKKRTFRFRLDEETDSIIKEALKEVNQYGNLNKVKEVYKK